MHNAIRPCLVLAAIVLASAVTLSVDPPDLRINEVSGLIETVDATWSGSNYNVRYTAVTSSGELTTSLLLTSNSANDVDPRIVVEPNGDALIGWWRDLSKDALVFRKHFYATGTWGLERFAGVTTESNSHPRMIYAGDQVWMAYVIQNAKSRSIGAQVIDDDPEPIRSILSTTSYTGDLDVQVDAESGHLWVTWIDSASSVGYSEFDYNRQIWSMTVRESYTGGSVADARGRIRSRILGL